MRIETLDVKVGAECFFMEKAKNRSLSCTKNINGVDLITCGAFLYFTLFVYLFLFVHLSVCLCCLVWCSAPQCYQTKGCV